MAAVVDAAADLFAAKGPAATSIREVAARSGVNHGLVYRHFGTKESLVAAVLDALSDKFVAGGGDEAGVAERHWRVLARAILDGYPVGQLQRRFPTVNGLVETARQSYPDDLEARLAAGHTVALTLGWQLFEPFIRSAAGLEQVPSRAVRAGVRDISGRLIRRHAVR
jgi:AcrR family transcriptional regulator